MKRLRDKFWKDSKKMIKWCTSEELRVLRTKAGNELERRLMEDLAKFDISEDERIAKGKRLAKRNSKAKQVNKP